MKVAVVTPTIGGEHLSKCLDSVQNQTYDNITHYVFIDGEDYYSKTIDLINQYKNTKYIILEENVGKGWYGHRVYSACSFLVNADIICYLDEDNYYEPNHVESIVNKINEGYDWVHSLRNIVEVDGTFICQDNCESLGRFPVFFDNNTHHIDTSTFAVKRDVAVRIGHAWYGQWGADRQFFYNINRAFPNWAGTGEYTLNYRLDGNPNSVKKEFFIDGNSKQEETLKTNIFPWSKNANV